ncbi:MAG: class B sortase [Lachnospiraceae bacterium]|nr:class B sortase [Lachnospiraceae bacterium]
MSHQKKDKNDKEALKKALKEAKFTSASRFLLGLVIVLGIGMIVAAVLFALKLSEEVKAQKEAEVLERFYSIEETEDNTGREVLSDVEGAEQDDILTRIGADRDGEANLPDEAERVIAGFSADYEGLRAVNPDFAGILYVPAVDLVEPVAAGADNQKYLKKTFRGAANAAGAVFLDAGCGADLSDLHLIFYGHNMRNGSRFGSLKQFLRDESLAEREPFIYLCREDGVRVYRIFACYTASERSDDFMLIPEGEAELASAYGKQARKRSLYRPAREADDAAYMPDFDTAPQILTLATCSGRAGTSRRLLVQAALVSYRGSSAASVEI